MRDLALIIFILPIFYFAFKRPALGVAVWAWTAFISPNYLVHGFADGLRYNLMAALITMAGYFFYKNKLKIAIPPLAIGVLLFFLWTSISSIFAIYDSPVIYKEWDKFFRGIILFVFVLLCIDKKEDFNVLAWAIVLSIGFYGGVEGLKYVNSGGSHHIFGPQGTNLSDNNHLALAMNMMLPFAIYLVRTIDKKIIRYGFILFILVTVMAIVGTNSRGGFASLAILTLAWFLQSDRKIIFATIVITAGVAAIHFIPDSYFDRMNTIENAEEDSSFQGRMVAWKQSYLIARDNPMTGGGFHAVQTRSVWEKYTPYFDDLDFIKTPHAESYTFKAAHSIYFQVLGDQGFIGLFLFLTVFIIAGLKARSIAKKRNIPEEKQWMQQLAHSCFLSLLIYAVGGGLLSMAYFEFAYIIVAIIAILDKNSRK